MMNTNMNLLEQRQFKGIMSLATRYLARKAAGGIWRVGMFRQLIDIIDKLRVDKYKKPAFSNLQTEFYPEYFPPNLENFAVVLKGKSIEKIGRVYQHYHDCFIANNFDKEIELLEEYLVGKNTVHFANRLMTAPLTPEHYQKMGITDIQLTKVSDKGDKILKQAVKHYKSLGLRTHFLPERLLRFNRDFGPEYANKYPYTGILAIIYALDIIRPKNLWIIGSDFYQADYLVRRPHANPIELQREKIDRLDIVNVFVKIVKQFPEVNVHMVTYYEGLPELDNLKIL